MAVELGSSVLGNPQALAVSSSSAAAPADPHFERIANGSYEIRESQFRATLSARDGLIYRPLDASPESSGGRELQVQLQRVSRGAAALFAKPETASGAAAAVASPGALTLVHTGFQEQYMARRDGVEQRFVFEQPPAGSGDLEFTFDVALKNLAPIASRPGRHGGTPFADASGAIAVRYGQVMVRDRTERGIVVEPQLSADGKSLAFKIPAAWLEAAAYPIVVDPLVGADFMVSPDNPTGVAQPSVAAGVTNYLVVWDDYTLGPQSPTLVASVVTSSAIVSPPIRLSATTAAPRPYRFQRVETAFDGANWLVVWAEDDAGGSAIHGAIVSSGVVSSAFGATAPAPGTILNNSDFAIAPTTGTVEEDPLCCFDGTDFFVAWTSGPTTTTGTSTGSQIFYTRVTNAGIVSSPTALVARTNPPNQALYFLAPQTPSGDTLLIFQENTETPVQTRGARVGSDGTLRDPGGISLFLADQASSGFGNPIGAAFINGGWQILSTYNQSKNSSIFQTLLSTSGQVTPPVGVFAVMGLGPTGTSLDSFSPAFAGSASWLFLRTEKVNNSVYHILGKRVGFNGTDQDPTPFQLDTSTQGILRSAVAAQAGGAFLVTWLDGRRAAVQPGDAHNIFASFVDGAIADTVTGALQPVVTASPLTGLAPLAVSFDSTGSTGAPDTLTWNFGDGANSTSPTVSHTYTRNGTFVAQLTITKGAYQVFQSVVVIVGGGSGTIGSSGGTQVGAPLQNSPGIVSSLLISSIQVALNFTSQNGDALSVTGNTDIGQLPTPLTGLTGSIAVGSQSFAFGLDAKGQFISDATQLPVVQFSLSGATGQFALQVTKGTLQANFANLGANNTTISPAIFVDVPVALAINTSSVTSIETMQYTATQNKVGNGIYLFKNGAVKGKVNSGAFIITAFSAKEQGPAGSIAHSYSINGELLRPMAANLTPAASGQFDFEIGNYSISLPTGQFSNDRGILKFISRLGTSGLKKFSLNPRTGVFSMQLILVPAKGANSSGLPVSTVDNTVSVDLNLSFQFDLADQQLTAGRFIFIARKNASAKSWALR